MSKGKGKEHTIPLPLMAPSLPPLSHPTTGSANPSASFSALWAYLLPALNHIVKSPTTDNSKAPAIDMGYYSGIHTAVYNYFNFQSEMATATHAGGGKDPATLSGSDLYNQLDAYLGDTCRDIFLSAPQDDSTLIRYLVPAFTRYSSGAQSISRLLQYVNRHYVKRAVDDDKGWLRLNDVLESVAKSITPQDTRERITKRLKERKTVELETWGYAEGGPPELLAQAEAYAEAASLPERIVPVTSLAMRQFRIEVVEPLLAIPKSKAKSKAKAKQKMAAANGLVVGPPGPKGRLARAVRWLLESEEVEEAERRIQAISLFMIIRRVGVRSDHVLYKKLDKYISTGSDN